MNAVPVDSVEQLRLIRLQIDYLLDQDDRQQVQAAALRPVAFNALDEHEVAHQLTLLATWVDWLIDRYELDEAIPACWQQHGPITEELAALRTSWHGAYSDLGARPFDGSNFHDALDRAVTRIRDWDRTGCARGPHRGEVTSRDGQRNGRKVTVVSNAASTSSMSFPGPKEH